MSVVENKELIRKIFDELALGNGAALTEAFADDCSWTFPGGWSWSGTWGPKTTVLQGLLRPLMSQFEGGYRMYADLILADADRVVVQARGYGTTVRGEAYHQTYCLVFQLTDGRIVEVIEHCDTALVERVLDRLVPVAP